MRGYCGIGIYEPKTTENMGTLWRSAYLFGASFIFTIGQRYRRQPTDTIKSIRHVPLLNYLDFEDFKNHTPDGAEIVFVEQTKKAIDIKNFKHPERAVYVLGSEDYGVPENLMENEKSVFIDTPRSLNVAVAGSIILFDRFNK